MNEIHVISPYKYHGTWVFDDARVGLLQEPFVAGADTWIDRSFFPARLFPVTNTGSIGVAQKVGATGITRLTWTWRDGYVRLFFDILRRSNVSLRPGKGASVVVYPVRLPCAMIMSKIPTTAIPPP
jgi:hypothetical protein